jgi:hypothetical protein
LQLDVWEGIVYVKEAEPVTFWSVDGTWCAGTRRRLGIDQAEFYMPPVLDSVASIHVRGIS